MTSLNVDEALFGQAETSSTSQSVTTGVKTFTLDVDNGYTQTDYTVQIISTADPDCWMYGVITSKSSPSITVNVFKVSETTGTFTDWTIQVIAGPFAGLPASQTLGFSSDSLNMNTAAVGDVLDWTIETGKAFYDNSTVYISAVNDRTAFVFATVVSYTSGTGALKLIINRKSSNTSTLALWAVSLIDVTQSFRTEVGDANYTIKPSDKIVALTVVLTTTRTWTLPLAASVPPGYTITVVDQSGGITPTNTLLIARAGSDTINESTLSAVLEAAYIQVNFISDGVSNWSHDLTAIGTYGESFSAFTYLYSSEGIATDGPTDLGDTLTVTGTATFNGNILGANFRDVSTFIYDNLDTTKLLNFQVADITTGTTRVVSWPDVAGYAVIASALTPMGYQTGHGGDVTQATSKSTAVTVNRSTGRIVMDSAALAAGASVAFTVNNSAVTANDTVIVNHRGTSGVFGNYRVEVGAIQAGSFDIRVTNITAGSLSQAVQLNFSVIKGAIT